MKRKGQKQTEKKITAEWNEKWPASPVQQRNRPEEKQTSGDRLSDANDAYFIRAVHVILADRLCMRVGQLSIVADQTYFAVEMLPTIICLVQVTIVIHKDDQRWFIRSLFFHRGLQ